MTASTYTLKDTISLIKSEINSTYPLQESQAIAYLVVENLLNISKQEVLLKQSEKVDNNIINKIKGIIQRLKNAEPIQYCLGETVFYDLIFKVKPGVLIPRPETEELVHLIINNNKTNNKINILDIGTGSGCIAISLAKNISNAKVYAMDISETALEIAKENANLNQVNIDFIRNDILENKLKLNTKFNIIVSNPPYVLDREKELMNLNVLNHEPELALFVSNNDPLKFYKAIVEFGKYNLNPKGQLYFEINESFGNEIAELLKDNNYSDIKIIKDIHDKDRMIQASFIF